MQFDKFVEKILLNEMPYVLVDVNDKRFDLEVEKFVRFDSVDGFKPRFIIYYKSQ